MTSQQKHRQLFKLGANLNTWSNMSRAEESEGHDFHFLDTPCESLHCSICLSVLKEPHLTSCCGNHFCRACITRILERGKPCPLCQEKDFGTFLDKSINRRINELQIHCPNSDQGCQWIGPLKSLNTHLKGSCEFIQVKCDLCDLKLLRSDLAQHKIESCIKRPFTCEYCGENDLWIVITRHHLTVCKKYPLPCPNDCNVGAVVRKDMDKHLKEDCPLQTVSCQYDYVGCRVQLPRREIGQHDAESTAQHLSLMSANFKRLMSEKDKKITKLEATINKQHIALGELKAKVTSLDSIKCKDKSARDVLEKRMSAIERRTVPIPPLDFYMTNFQYHWSNQDQWFSEPFYSHSGGYKMCLNVYAYGTGHGLGSHVSVYVNLMRGEFDHNLVWPFVGDIDVTLIGYEEDYEETLCFTHRSPAKATKRVTEGDMNEYGQGVSRFVDHYEVSEYSTLHFRVTGIDCDCL